MTYFGDSFGTLRVAKHPSWHLAAEAPRTSYMLPGTNFRIVKYLNHPQKHFSCTENKEEGTRGMEK